MKNKDFLSRWVGVFLKLAFYFRFNPDLHFSLIFTPIIANDKINRSFAKLKTG